MMKGKIALLNLLCFVLCGSVSAGVPKCNSKPKGFMSIKPDHKATIAITLPNERWVGGMDSLSSESELYAVAGSTVYVISRNASTQQHSIKKQVTVKNLFRALGLVASGYDDRRRLYISGNHVDDGYIYVVDADDESVSKWIPDPHWKLNSGQGPVSVLSMARWDKILVSTYNLDNEILHYSLDGEFKKRTKQNYVKGIGGSCCFIHIVQLHKDDYVVAGRTFRNDVFIMHNNGSLLKSYNEQKRPTDYKFDYPEFLAVDPYYNVLVVDRGRLILLTSSLEYVRKIQPSGLSDLRPKRVYYDKEREVVYIGDYARIVELKL